MNNRVLQKQIPTKPKFLHIPMNDSPIPNIRQAQARLQNERECETVGKNIKLPQPFKKRNYIFWAIAFGEGFETRVPDDNLRVSAVDASEDLLGVGESGGRRESADGGDAGEREERERRRGFEEVGMELFELKWRVEGVEKRKEMIRRRIG